MFSSTYLLYFFVAFIVLLLVVGLIYHQALGALRKRIHDAREGLLLPVEIPAILPPFVRSLLKDYNTTILTLGSMFKTVEECQSRVLNERNRINAILQSLSGALITVSTDLNISISNRLAEKTFANEEQSLLGINLFDLIHFKTEDRDILRDSFLYKKPIKNHEICLEVNLKPKWFYLNVAFFSETDIDMEAIIILLDISENHDMQEALSNSEKLIAMGQLAAGVAHELNTPLGNIQGYIQLIKKDLALKGKQYEFASIVEEETMKCSKIITDLLSLANNEKCSGASCDINEVLKNISETFLSCRTRRYGIDINMELQNGLPMLEGECGQLEIVLTNLISNAIQALDGRESPYIKLRSWFESSDYVFVSVEDNGPGIPAEIRRNIFDPFFTTKEVGSGSGLGLSISRAILHKRGAFIKFDEGYNLGTRFIIGLPFVNVMRKVS